MKSDLFLKSVIVENKLSNITGGGVIVQDTIGERQTIRQFLWIIRDTEPYTDERTVEF